MTPAQFKTRFPAFADVSDETVQSVLDEATARTVAGSWTSSTDYDLAIMLYTAHTLTLDGQGTSTEAQLAGFKRLRIGSLELERQDAGSTSFGSMSSTSYGQRYLQLVRLNFPPVLVV